MAGTTLSQQAPALSIVPPPGLKSWIGWKLQVQQLLPDWFRPVHFKTEAGASQSPAVTALQLFLL